MISFTNKKRKRKQITCLCDSYWFPHRKGSGWCIHNPNVEQFAKKRNYDNSYLGCKR